MRPPRFHRLLPVLFGVLLLLLPATASAASPAGTSSTAAAPIGGGSPLTINGARCVAGFAAGHGGGPGFLIAGGACGRTGDTVYSNGVLVGTVVAAKFPGRPSVLIEVTNTADWTLVPWAGAAPVRVTGSTEAPVGSTVCLYGSGADAYCGPLLARNLTIEFPEGTVTGVAQAAICAPPEASGGPLLAGTQAQGVLVGSSGNCSGDGASFFMPVNEILAAHDLTLLLD